MNILVTGGGGFLGTTIVKQLLDKKYNVTSLSRNSYTHLEELGVPTIQIDLGDTEKVNKLDLSGFDAIFHVAALAGVWGRYETYYNINYLGTKNLVDKAIEDGVEHFIYTSTPSVVFGDDDILGGDESIEYPSKYYTHYAKTKAMAESYLRDNSTDTFKTISIRPHLIWGEGDPHLIPRLREKAKQGKLRIVGNGDNLVDVIHVSNAAAAHLNALDALSQNSSLSGNAYFVGQENPVNLWEFINQILNVYKINPVESYISFKLAFIIGFVFEKVYLLFGIISPEPPMTRFISLQLAKSHYFSHAKALEDLNYTPVVSIKEGLLKLKAEYEAKPISE
jgi:nucleoside-diphosphate-sugar epimerase